MLHHPSRPEPETWLVSPRGPIRREVVSTHEALERWEAHRAGFPQTGLWPIVVPFENAEIIEQSFKDQAEGVEDAVAMGMNLNVGDFFSGMLDDFAEDDEFELDLDFDPTALVASDPGSAETQIGLPATEGGESWIALVPCREPWEVPAVLGYGSWNDCPMPAEHVAVLREWHARHGAVPLVVGGDTLQLLVRPFDDPEEAKRVAFEHYAYCPDIVDQGVGTVEALAASLLGSSVWFFWWD